MQEGTGWIFSLEIPVPFVFMGGGKGWLLRK